ncbi:MAG: BPL-N domain-containing protein [Thermoanaerobacteraceae bacterium]|nr:BPL-N domain-containing protein [Thermoanaerobacteraceae bacterium]
MTDHDVIIPMDRLGVVNVQKKPMEAVNYINGLIKKNINVNWIMNPTVLKTSDFPEGHIYGPGGFLANLNEEEYSMLHGTDLKYSDIVEYISGGYSKLNKKKIALYVGIGSAEFCFKPLMEVLNLSVFEFKEVNDKDIRENLLDDFDIFIVPGGPDAGESFYHGLGDRGYDNIKRFLHNKGQYLGICAGAYLPLTSNDENNIWLNIVDATDDNELDYI